MLDLQRKALDHGCTDFRRRYPPEANAMTRLAFKLPE
jgi:hypothetical protein